MRKYKISGSFSLLDRYINQPLKAETAALNMKSMGNFTDISDAESKYLFTILHNWL